jgi:hypothetical protein
VRSRRKRRLLVTRVPRSGRPSKGKSDPNDLRGGARALRRFIGWQTFFAFGDGALRPNKRIDTKISAPLFNLPLQAIPAGEPPISLPQRNPLRHLTWQLPSGQAIAREMGVSALEKEDLAELRSIYPSFDVSTPLWYYILKEAEIMEEDKHLGPVGGRISLVYCARSPALIPVQNLSPSVLSGERPGRPGQA